MSKLRLASYLALGTSFLVLAWAALAPADRRERPSDPRAQVATPGPVAPGAPGSEAARLAPEEGRYRAAQPLRSYARRAQSTLDQFVGRGQLRKPEEADVGTIEAGADTARNLDGVSASYYRGPKLVVCRTATEMRQPTVVCLGRDLVARKEFVQYNRRPAALDPVEFQDRAIDRAHRKLGSPKTVIPAPR